MRSSHDVDIMFAGTFAAWRLGTLQARALPLAIALRSLGLRCAIVTVPWDAPSEAGVIDMRSGAVLMNTRNTAITRTPLAVAEQMAQVRRCAPRAVHVFKPRGFGGLSALSLRRELPIIVDADDWEGDGGWNRLGNYGPLQRRLFDWQERALLRDAWAVTAASTLLEHRARRLRDGAGRERVAYLPNGLPRARWQELVDATNDGPDPPSVLLYSRGAEFDRDWPERFSAALASRIAAPARVLIAGMDASAATHGALQVVPLGYLPIDAIAGVLGEATVAVYPYRDSLVARSKQSVKLLELMAASCGVVATDGGDIARTLGNTGVIIDGDDPDAFATVAAQLLADRARTRSLGRSASRRVRERFLIEDAIAPALLAAYRRFGVLSA